MRAVDGMGRGAIRKGQEEGADHGGTKYDSVEGLPPGTDRLLSDLGTVLLWKGCHLFSCLAGNGKREGGGWLALQLLYTYLERPRIPLYPRKAIGPLDLRKGARGIEGGSNWKEMMGPVALSGRVEKKRDALGQILGGLRGIRGWEKSVRNYGEYIAEAFIDTDWKICSRTYGVLHSLKRVQTDHLKRSRGREKAGGGSL